MTASTSTGPTTTVSKPQQISCSSGIDSVLSEIGPIKMTAAHVKSNRGRKPMKSTVLTSPENITDLKEKRQKRDEAKKKKEDRAQKRKHSLQNKPAKTRKQPKRAITTSRKSSSTVEEDVDSA